MFALQWASQFRGDAFALSTLRRLIGSAFPPRSDEQVAQEVAWRLTTGVWLARRRVIRKASGLGGRPEEAPPFPREDRRSTAPQVVSPPTDASLFPDDIDPVAIAEGQRQAAVLGVPFCEECLKAQLAARLAPSPSEEPVEPPLFPDDVAPSATAEALKKAAALGTPFCEECHRAQMAER